MYVINVSNKRKTGKWRKICLFPAGFEPATLCVWGTRDNRYTMETCYVCRLLFGFHITGWLTKKWKKLSSHLGVEPRTFGLEVQRAIHCANGTPDTHWLLKMVLFRNAEKMTESLCRIEYYHKSVLHFITKPFDPAFFIEKQKFCSPEQGLEPWTVRLKA